MTSIEKAAESAVAARDGIRPLERAIGVSPVLATPAATAIAASATALYAAGNMVTDFVGQESRLAVPGVSLAGKSGAELLDIRRQGLHV